MNCSICGKPIVLVPSAAERARKHGGSAAEYVALFTEHAKCIVTKREQETRAMLDKANAERLNRRKTCT